MSHPVPGPWAWCRRRGVGSCVADDARQRRDAQSGQAVVRERSVGGSARHAPRPRVSPSPLFLTSDHGTWKPRVAGRRGKKSLAELRGQRARVYVIGVLGDRGSRPGFRMRLNGRRPDCPRITSRCWLPGAGHSFARRSVGGPWRYHPGGGHRTLRLDRAEVMSGTTRRIIGFDRKVRLRWLDATPSGPCKGSLRPGDSRTASNDSSTDRWPAKVLTARGARR